ncbi:MULTISPECIES: MetQ/NlpA family ABC transporter substrate-binding protein [Nocardiopsis]|uniref:NLPA lipoprotein n=1 Tax=Nocardiopsis dassonvillei (strain ATCC 23218 / DSM 43111 / CIP 107115 / JCM 7437 / KCTC 9190 / NBRC 14626 / NCTC 10488 / NRRL B-5397 / IMRU 509) TaxID=446468 RepID=D7B394_NOCDD|nr:MULTISPECIES: MetQ/NlpA family ABC transporter substrate-binding protein [Nocardiopsis]ADH66822.1 NLPA lipoprotein [Nocardiopsis dassonvillei subsp. dassonvillei DSM 43111]APC35094.1 metal ABC transporter substrate-binding protein [Nocardiopsis dassonvillei]NKY80025.1 metal ABC transporter substrate-binding protein [Nocardiopsis dassonvillei]VEI86495.1 29 kDa protein [Nocardiopsis dassonvillei]
MRTTPAALGAAALTLALAACGAPSEQAAESGGEGDVLRVGVSPVPHGDILAFIEENLAEEAGLNLEIEEISDYNVPNTALVEGELDANYFQHRAFLNEWTANGPDAELTYLTDVHIERLGLYSESVESIDDLPDGAEIAVPNDPANLARALGILEAEGLVTVDPEAGESATEKDIVDNPRDITVTPLEAAQLPRSISDVDAAVVNGNYAIETDLPEQSNVLAWEPEGDDYVESYANGLVTLAENAEDERIQLLAELLHDERVLEFIQESWQGVVLAVDAEGDIVETAAGDDASESPEASADDATESPEADQE